MSLNQDTPVRKKLDGHSATAGEFAQKVARLMLGDSSHGVEPMSQIEIMKKLGFKEKKSIRNFKLLAIEMGLLELDGEGKAKLPAKTGIHNFKQYNKNHEFTSDERIIYWQKDLLTRKKGAPLGTWKSLMSKFESICNTLETTPEQWVSGKDTNQILIQGRIYIKEFMEQYKLHQAKIQYAGNWDLKKCNIAAVTYSYAKAARDFMGVFNIKYQDGETGVMSQSIAEFHGNFSDVLLTDEELVKADKWLKEKYGIDSDPFRIFWFGVEGMPRNRAISGAKSNYTRYISKKTGKPIYIMEVYESKTKHIKRGIIKKYIKNPDLQASIDKVRERGGEFVVEKRMGQTMFTTHFGGIFRELWIYLGKEKLHLANPEDETSGYFMKHSIHALRHIGAHFHLRKSRYNFGLVASIGGWKKIDELKDSYGELPDDVKISMMEDEEY